MAIEMKRIEIADVVDEAAGFGAHHLRIQLPEPFPEFGRDSAQKLVRGMSGLLLKEFPLRVLAPRK